MPRVAQSKIGAVVDFFRTSSLEVMEIAKDLVDDAVRQRRQKSEKGKAAQQKINKPAAVAPAAAVPAKPKAVAQKAKAKKAVKKRAPRAKAAAAPPAASTEIDTPLPGLTEEPVAGEPYEELEPEPELVEQ